MFDSGTLKVFLIYCVLLFSNNNEDSSNCLDIGSGYCEC